MSQRGPQPATQQPGVEGVVAVLYQHRPPGEAEKGAAGVAELGRPDQHRSVDQVAAPGIGIDRRPAVDEGIEQREGAGEAEPLSTDLEHQEGPVAGGLNVHGDEFGLIEGCGGTGFGSGGCGLRVLPGDRLDRATRLEQNRKGWRAPARSFSGAHPALRVGSALLPPPPSATYIAFLLVNTRTSWIRRILRSNARLQFSM
jgi:hypothetical protein